MVTPGAGADALHRHATIECLVDKEGRVRLPRVLTASDDAAGYAAVQAVNAWWFEPPRAGGKAVVARVEIPLAVGAAPGK